MNSPEKEKELRISGYDFPIVRAGFANILLLILFFFLILLNQLLSDLSFSYLSRILLMALIFAITIKIYLHSVAMVYKKEDGSLIITGPVSEKRFHFSHRIETKIFKMPASMTILLMIKKENSVFPSFFFFVAVSNLLGSFDDTKQKLASILENP